MRLPCHFNANFDCYQEKLIPIIFIHGLTANNFIHSGLLRELASHGYFVIAMDTNDGSCTYTETPKGSIEFDYYNLPNSTHVPYKPMLIKRVEQVRLLIDELE